MSENLCNKKNIVEKIIKKKKKQDNYKWEEM